MLRNEERLKKLNLLGNSSCIFWAGYRKALLSRYLEAVLGRKMYLLSCQCWNGWIWDLRLLLGCWICNSTNLLSVYTMKTKALHLSCSGVYELGWIHWKQHIKNPVLLKQELESKNDTIRSQAEQSIFVQRNKSVGLQSMLPDDAVAKMYMCSN